MSNLVRRLLDWPLTSVLSYTVIFGVLAWRLFAIGSEQQLFLYGDNLQFVNAISHYAANLNWLHPLSAYISEHGMLGSYAMADPQTSFLYFPITLMILLTQWLGLGPVSVYYLLLLSHGLHLLVGCWAIYLIASQVFRLPKRLAWLGGVVYLGLGWNVSWMDAGSLSHMVGWIPLLLYTLLRYWQVPNWKRLLWYFVSFVCFLYAGGIVNFFFYFWINAALFTLVSAYMRLEWLAPQRSVKQYLWLACISFLHVPILALLVYAAQLVLSMAISADIVHSSSAYDYLAFFGFRFSDLLGLILPRFGLLEFGLQADPRLMFTEGGKEIYAGLLPLLLLGMGIFYIRDRVAQVIMALLALNLLLSFGGMTALYHLAFAFPGNTLFRGHYKIFILVGCYLAILVPFIIDRLRGQTISDEQWQSLGGVVRRLAWILATLTLLAGFAAFAFAAMRSSGIVYIYDYALIARTLLNYLARTLLFLGIAYWALRLVLASKLTYFNVAGVALLLLIDTSINYLYAQRYAMPITQVVRSEMLSSLQGTTVWNEIPGYSQLYLIPAVVEADPLRMYSPIPNRYLVDFNERLDAVGGDLVSKVNLLQVAGVERLITATPHVHPQLQLLQEVPLATVAESLFIYKANGSLHQEWGEPSSAGTVYVYGLDQPAPAYWYTQVDHVSDEIEEEQRLATCRFSRDVPMLLTGKTLEVEAPVARPIQYQIDEPTRKQLKLDQSGILITTIPYSALWKASTAEGPVAVFRANSAFVGVEVPAGELTLALDTAKLKTGFWVAGLALILAALLLGWYRRFEQQLLS